MKKSNKCKHISIYQNTGMFCRSNAVRLARPIDSCTTKSRQSAVRAFKNDKKIGKKVDIELFETIGTDKDTSSFEPFAKGSSWLDSFDTSEPKSFDGEEKEGYDPLRDGPLRYLGYSNEVGEAFSAWLFPGGVPLSYAVAVSYVLFDTWDKYNGTLSDAERKLGANKMPDGTDREKLISTIGLERGIDTLVWQLLASVMIPGYTIHTIVGVTTQILKGILQGNAVGDLANSVGESTGYSPDTILQLTEKSLPTFVGLMAIPFIVHPIDSGVHGILNATLRPKMRTYICKSCGGQKAGIPACQDCQD
jgi:fission process protein 1